MLALNSSLLTTSLLTTLLSLLKSTQTGFHLASNSDDLSISNWLTSDFKLVKSSFLANCDVSTLVAFLGWIFLDN